MTSAEQEKFVEQQVATVKAAVDRFSPAGYLPVKIDFRTEPNNPYELSEDVTYTNPIVHVVMERGFKWDGASIPVWWPLLPWLATLVLMHFVSSLWVWLIAIPLVAYTLRLLPYMQKMGLHARAACAHDRIYRSQEVDYRVVADAILLSIMEGDGVPWDIRLQIYMHVRLYGWVAWRRNARCLAAAAEQRRNDNA